jgi:hypothetical protein
MPRRKEQTMSQAVFCLAKSQDQAIEIIHDLHLGAFPGDHVSVLVPEPSPAHRALTNGNARTGAILRGALEWMSSIGALAIGGLGPFIAAGPIMNSLSASARGVIGALTFMGMPEYIAARYRVALGRGGAMISVHADQEEDLALAKEIFNRCGATSITVAGDSFSPLGEEAEIY